VPSNHLLHKRAPSLNVAVAVVKVQREIHQAADLSELSHLIERRLDRPLERDIHPHQQGRTVTAQASQRLADPADVIRRA
jgi:hypothetical protein